jgi:MFS family permease
MLKRLLTPINFGIKRAFSDITLVVNSLVWYYIVLIIVLQGIVIQSYFNDVYQIVLICTLHFGGLIVTALAGASISKKIDYKRYMIIWMALGILSSLTLLIINFSDIVQVSIVFLLLGVSLGLGMPKCMGHYAHSIPVENRGQLSGITIFVSGLGIVAFSVAGIGDIIILGAILAIWRLVGLLIFLFTKVNAVPLETKEAQPKYREVFGQHSFILYFIPWVMFSLINYLVSPVSPTINVGDLGTLTLIQTSFMGLFALLGGFFIDTIGRKRIAVTGFILLGLGAAALGISWTMPFLYFNVIMDGIAWGFLLVLFILTVWGDLSQSESSDKFYAVGVMPFFISKFLDLTVGRYLASSLNNSSALFSFGAFFLFLAVLPLIYAPETLPEKNIKERELKNYLEKAQNLVAKESKQKPEKKKNQEKEETKEDQKEENSKEYDEARKLAEKYY